MMWSMLRYELAWQWRFSGQLIQSLGFIMVAMTAMVLSLKPDSFVLHEIAPGLMWVLAIFASQLNHRRVFEQELLSGLLEQKILMLGQIYPIIIMKWVCETIATSVPMAFFVPLTGIFFGMQADEMGIMMVLMALGLSGLTMLGILSAALLMGAKKSSAALNLLLVLPLSLPIVVFGSGAYTGFVLDGFYDRVWTGITMLIACNAVLFPMMLVIGNLRIREILK